MGYKINVESYFSGAHRLRGYKGKCESLHGHNWKVEVILSAKKLDKIGMVIDFTKAKSILMDILSTLDHKYINQVAYFKKHNPTSEIIAEFIYKKYSQKLKKQARIESVSVWETPTSCATYSKD